MPPANLLNAIPTWQITVIVAILIVAMNEVGYRVGRKIHLASEFSSEDPSSLVQAAAFTLVALLLTFSFSLALGRFDSRRETFVKEANAIGTTFLRADLLDPVMASAMKDDLKAYVAVRIDFARADADPARRDLDAERSAHLQGMMWAVAMQAAHRDPHSTTIPLLIGTLNDTIDMATAEHAVLEAHIPDIVMIGLIFIALVAAGMAGYGFGRRGQRGWVPKILYALMLALSLGLVFDLDRPQRGFVRVNLAPMVALQHDIERMH